ncbi:hypothetical protein Patl1_29787 [Pistacia atlantica]|uniref:Uncharacterized protein n=1 Tax=Pistacia atlantica TaxID=434234 RepID=A0ACC1ABE4_9ROSI|nr:hypothetical protein Patl1_29787 [Pistacia atlantica]
MDRSIYNHPSRNEFASASSKSGRPVKRIKAETYSSRIQEVTSAPQEIPSAGSRPPTEASESARRHERSQTTRSPLLFRTLDEMSHRLDQMDLQAIAENPVFAVEQCRLLCASAKLNYSDEFELCRLQAAHFSHTMACAFELRKLTLDQEDQFQRATSGYEATISNQSETISKLKAELALKCNRLAETEAKLKRCEASLEEVAARHFRSELVLFRNRADFDEKLKKSEASQGHLRARVELLETELMRRQAEVEALQNQAVDSEQKVWNSENKALSLVKKIANWENSSREMSAAAAKAMEEFMGSSVFEGRGAQLLMYLSSSNEQNNQNQAP